MLPSPKNKILFLVAHPHLQKSRANRAIVEAVKDLPGLTLVDLYDAYPYFHIDVAQEQSRLRSHSHIVVQHPFYWYSMPPLMKLWLDEVLESGWAYGPGGDKLKDKKFLLSLTVGGAHEVYSPQGKNRFAMETLLAPWNQTVHLCQMQWHEPILLHGAIRASDTELIRHAQGVRQRLESYVG